jgi:DNA-binding transcriptional MerR regulator
VNSYRISQLAESSGFSASALRYYEQVGLLSAQRTPSGYRTYDESEVTRLRFIARAKALGLSLDEIRELVSVWDGGQCATVKLRLAELITHRSRDVAARIGELAAFDAELIRARSALAGPTPPGACDENCGCSEGSSQVTLGMPQLLDGRPDREAAESPIACTLSSDKALDQIEEWTRVLAGNRGRAAIPMGVRFTFDNDSELVGRLAALASREQQCCSFFTFTLTISTPSVVTLDVYAPQAAQEVLHDVFGAV